MSSDQAERENLRRAITCVKASVAQSASNTYISIERDMLKTLVSALDGGAVSQVKLSAGLYYQTAAGVEFGPMVLWGVDDEERGRKLYQVAGKSFIWREDGTRWDRSDADNDLIALRTPQPQPQPSVERDKLLADIKRRVKNLPVTEFAGIDRSEVLAILHSFLAAEKEPRE